MQYEPDAILMRAELAAVRSCQGNYHPLTRAQVIMVACSAAWRERVKLLRETLTEAEFEGRLTTAATDAVNAARAGSLPHPLLLGGIETLPQPQALVLSLRFSEGLTDAEIAAVLGCTPLEVRILTAQAFSALLR